MPIKNRLPLLSFGVSQIEWMHRFVLRALLIFLLCIPAAFSSLSQNNVPTVYDSVLRERSSKILAVIQFTDNLQKSKALDLLVQQYKQVNLLHETIAQDSLRLEELRKQHTVFLNQLQDFMTPLQIEQVKDGMTYRV